MPDVGNLKILARLLNVSVDYLLDETEESENPVIRETYQLAGYGYGCGVQIVMEPEKMGSAAPAGGFGWDGAAGSYVMIDPEQKLSIFFAMHVRGWPRLIGCGHAPIRDLTYEVLGL